MNEIIIVFVVVYVNLVKVFLRLNICLKGKMEEVSKVVGKI